MEAEDKKLRKQILRRMKKLEQMREPYVAQWQKISEHITPASGRFINEKTKNRARSRWNRIYDNTAVRAANILQAGLMSGMTDPSSQWFALTTGTPELDEPHEVKVWLDQVQRIMEMAFAKTNVYQALQHAWREVGVYGVCAIVLDEDPLYSLVAHPLACGEYCIACDFRGKPDTLYRTFNMTAGQMIEAYGRKAVSRAVREAYDKGNVDQEFECIHAIEPRRDRDTRKRDNLNMPFRSIVIQKTVEQQEENKVLEESGYQSFPAIIGRWGASASDVYSEEAPGIVAIGDDLQLQHHQLQKGNAIDYMVNPPLVMPSDARDRESDFLPGGRTYIDNPSAGAQVQPAFNVNLPLGELNQDVLDIRNRINAAFSVDMFLMVSNANRAQMTAEEVSRRHEEKLMMLGPVLSRLNQEVLQSLIERAFEILSRQGQLPPPPEALRGRQLSIEYTSMLARSQRAIRAGGLDQLLSRVERVGQYKPEALAKIDGLAVIDEYADYFSVAPSVIVPNDVVQAQMQAQQEQAAQAQQAEQAQMSADALSKLGKVPADESTMAGKALGQLGRMQADAQEE